MMICIHLKCFTYVWNDYSKSWDKKVHLVVQSLVVSTEVYHVCSGYPYSDWHNLHYTISFWVFKRSDFINIICGIYMHWLLGLVIYITTICLNMGNLVVLYKNNVTFLIIELAIEMTVIIIKHRLTCWAIRINAVSLYLSTLVKIKV